jgi:hypothetical protein
MQGLGASPSDVARVEPARREREFALHRALRPSIAPIVVFP